MREIVIVGAGGLGREVAWLIEDINRHGGDWRILGFSDDVAIKGTLINGYPVLGNLSWLCEQRTNVAIAIGNPSARKNVRARLQNSANTYPILVHPSSIVSPLTRLSDGVIVCAGNIISLNAEIGQQAFINLSCTVGHDVRVGDFCVIMPGVNISGNVCLGSCVSIGTGTAIIQGVTVGERGIVGAGAVVVRDLPPDCTAVGSPARPIKFHAN